MNNVNALPASCDLGALGLDPAALTSVQTIGDLMGRTRAELLKIRNLGKISLREIEEKLEPFGLSIKGEEPEDEEDILKEDEAR